MYKVMFGPVSHAKFISWAKDHSDAIEKTLEYARKNHFDTRKVNLSNINGITVVEVGSKDEFGFIKEVQPNG